MLSQSDRTSQHPGGKGTPDGLQSGEGGGRQLGEHLRKRTWGLGREETVEGDVALGNRWLRKGQVRSGANGWVGRDRQLEPACPHSKLLQASR